jgi:hypothetical protein
MANVPELGNELVTQTLINHRDGQRARLVGQQVTVVGRLKVQLEV